MCSICTMKVTCPGSCRSKSLCFSLACGTPTLCRSALAPPAFPPQAPFALRITCIGYHANPMALSHEDAVHTAQPGGGDAKCCLCALPQSAQGSATVRVQAYWADVVAMECSTGEDEAMVAIAPSPAKYTPSLGQGANRSDDQQTNVTDGEKSDLPTRSIASGRMHASQHAPPAAERTFSPIHGTNSSDDRRNNGAGREVSLMPALSLGSERVHAAEHAQHADHPTQMSVQCMLTEDRVVPTCMSGRTHTAQRPTLPLSTTNGNPELCQLEQPYHTEFGSFVCDSERLSAQLSEQRYRWRGLETLTCQASSKSDVRPARTLCPSGSSCGGAATAQEREVEGGGGARLLMRIAMEYCEHGAVPVCMRAASAVLPLYSTNVHEQGAALSW